MACEPNYLPDDNEFTESIQEMTKRIQGEMEAERKARWEERVKLTAPPGEGVAPMDTTAAAATGDPSAIPGTDLHVVPPPGTTMQDFSQTGKAID